MGIDDRDDYRSRGQAARRRGSYESSEPPAGRSQHRGGRDDAPRGRPRGADDYSSRGSGRRDYGREDDPRSSSGSRNQRGYDGSGGYERRPRPDQSGAARRPRGDWDDEPSSRRRLPDDYTRGDRSARGQRPPMREYTDASMRSRGGPRGMGDSGARGRSGAAVAQQRGGLWGEEQLRSPGLRPGMAGARDPRAARRDEAADEDATSPGAAFGKALLAIILALLIGAGAAYGYYIYSTPKIPANAAQPSTTPASGSGGSTGGGSVASAHNASVSALGDSRVMLVAGAANGTD